MAVRKLRLRESSLNGNYNKAIDLIKDVTVYPINQNVLNDLLVDMFENALKQNNINYKLDGFDIFVDDIDYSGNYFSIMINGWTTGSAITSYIYNNLSKDSQLRNPDNEAYAQLNFKWDKQANEIGLNLDFSLYTDNRSDKSRYEKFITDLQDIETFVVRPILEATGLV